MFYHQFPESSLSSMGSAVEPIHFLCQVLCISVLKFLLISSLYLLGVFAKNFFSSFIDAWVFPLVSSIFVMAGGNILGGFL